MSVVTSFPTLSESYAQKIQANIETIKEYNAPMWNLLRGKLEKTSAGEKGLKIVYDNLTAGGHSTPTLTRPDWNEPVANEELSSYVYPVRYRLPMIFDHGLLRDLKNGKVSAAHSLRRELKKFITVALKRLERNMPGDGSGSVAYSTSTTTVLGSQSINCDTTPAVSAGHTKGAKWLKKNNWYQAVNASTGLARGLFQVTIEGATSCTVNIVSGTISSGDPIVDVNTYNGYFRGLAWLISEANRIIQGINTADNGDFNSIGIDLAGAPLTFVAIEDMLTSLQIRNNDGGKTGKVLIMPPGQSSVLRKSAQNLRVYNDGTNIVQGIAEDIDFGSNITVVLAADMDEDRAYSLVYDEFGMLEEMPLDVMQMDGQEWHQLMGANNSGSERYQRGVGWDGNFYRKASADSSAYIYRASVTGVLGQATI